MVSLKVRLWKSCQYSAMEWTGFLFLGGRVWIIILLFTDCAPGSIDKVDCTSSDQCEGGNRQCTDGNFCGIRRCNRDANCLKVRAANNGGYYTAECQELENGIFGLGLCQYSKSPKQDWLTMFWFYWVKYTPIELNDSKLSTLFNPEVLIVAQSSSWNPWNPWSPWNLWNPKNPNPKPLCTFIPIFSPSISINLVIVYQQFLKHSVIQIENYSLIWKN